MKTYGLVLDCDGTLIDSLGAALSSFNYALSAIGEAPRELAEIKSHFGVGADRIFSRLLGYEPQARLAFDAYVEHQADLAARMPLHPGILELLQTAKSARIPMAIVTGRHERDLHAVLRPHEILHYFDALIADSHLQNSKPAPDGILLAAAKLNLEPQNICYVGDSPIDIRAARAAGSGAIAAMWDSLVIPEAMQLERPHYLAETPAEAWSHFAAFCSEHGS